MAIEPSRMLHRPYLVAHKSIYFSFLEGIFNRSDKGSVIHQVYAATISEKKTFCPSQRVIPPK